MHFPFLPLCVPRSAVPASLLVPLHYWDCAYTVDSATAENQWLHLPLITQLKKDCRSIFPVAEYGYTTIPTYPSGQIGFMVCSKDPNADVKTPLRKWTKEEEDAKCRYYSSEIHKASFVLPKFAEKALE